MSSLNEVKQATCQILNDDGISNNGTGFFILPTGYILTCHHVIFGLQRLQVKISNGEVFQAEYLEKFSNPVADFAVLKLSNVTVGAVQLGRIREGCEVYGYGFRPKEIYIEPKGHTFPGHLEPGQELRFPVSSDIKALIEEIPLDQRQPWNILSDEFRINNVRTFISAGNLEPGISGGPVYDKQLRRVVGIFRAIEEKDGIPSKIAYVIPIDDIFTCWQDLEEINRLSVPDTDEDCLKRDYGIQLVPEGGRPVSPILLRRFESIFSSYQIFGRNRQLTLLNQFVDEKISGYFFVTGPAGYGKTALLSNWAKSLESKGVHTAVHLINPMIDASINFCLKNLCEQLMAFRNLGNIPQDESKLQDLFNFLLKKSPSPKKLVIILDGLDEADDWPDLSYVVPPILPEGIFFVVSMRGSEIDEIEYLKERLRCTNHLLLPPLSADDIVDWIQSSENNTLKSLSRDEKFIATVVEKTEGFPLYLHYLIDEIIHSPIEKCASILEQSPSGFSSYVHKQFHNLVNEKNVGNNRKFQELFALLSIAHSALSENDIIEVTEITKWDLQKLPWALKRWFNIIVTHYPPLYSFSHPLLAQEFKRELGDESQRALNSLLNYCSRYQEHKSPYAFHNFTEHLRETQQYEKLFALIDNEAFWDIPFETFPEDLLQIISKNFHVALKAAIEINDAGLIAKYLISHAKMLAIIRDKSPSDTLSKDNLQLAWELADLSDYDVSILWYLFLTWELKKSGKLDEANKTLVRLLKRYIPTSSRIVGWGRYAAALLVSIFDISEEMFFQIQQQFFNDHDRFILCEYLSMSGYFEAAKKIVLKIKNLECKVNALVLMSNFQIQEEKMWDAIDLLDFAMKLSRGFKDFEKRKRIQLSIEQTRGRAYNFSSADEVEQSYFWEQFEKEVLNDFDSVIDRAEEINDKNERIHIFCSIAEIQSRNGANKLAQKAFKIAIEHAQTISETELHMKKHVTIIKNGILRTIVRSTNERATQLVYIAQTQANTRDFKSALETSYLIEEREIRSNALAYIAKKQADDGDIVSATKISDEIKDEMIKVILEAAETNEKGLDLLLENDSGFDFSNPAFGSKEYILNSYLEVLASIATNQIKNGKKELARDTFYKAINTAQRFAGGLWIEDLKPIIKAMAKTDEFVLNVVSLHQIKLQNLKEETLIEIAKNQVKLDNFEVALNIVSAIKEENMKVKLLALIAEKQVGNKREALKVLKTAQGIVNNINDKEYLSADFIILAKAFARIKEIKLAKRSFDNALKNALKINHGSLALSAEDYENQLNIYTSSVEISKEIEKNSKRWNILKAISRAQAEVGYFTDAIKVANKIEFSVEKDEVLQFIAIEQTKEGSITPAFETINKITDSILKYHTLNSVFEEITEPHDLEYAIKHAEKIETEEKDYIFLSIVKAYIKLGDLNSAFCTAMKIKDNSKKDEALKYFAKAKAETGDFTSAFTVIQDFENDYKYDEALGYISKSLAKANDFTSALETVRGIGDKHLQENALESISLEQAKIGDYVSAIDTAKTIEDQLKQVKLLVAIAEKQISVNKIMEAKLITGIALNLTIGICDNKEKCKALITIINLKIINNDRILRIAETILTDQERYLPNIAKSLIAADDLDNFKKLLIPCSYYLESAYTMCESLTKLYPNQSQSVLKVIEESELLLSYISPIDDPETSRNFQINNIKVFPKMALKQFLRNWIKKVV